MKQTYNHSNASLSRKEAKSEGKDISSWYKGKPVKSASKSKALHKAKSDRKYKQYLEDSHSAAAEHRGGNEN